MKLFCWLLLLGASRGAETTAAWRARMRDEFQTVFDENNGIVPQATAFIVAVADPLHGDASCDATTEAPTTAQTFEPTAAPESDAAGRMSPAVGAVAVALLALVV